MCIRKSGHLPFWITRASNGLFKTATSLLFNLISIQLSSLQAVIFLHPPTPSHMWDHPSPQSELHPATGRYVNALSCVVVLQWYNLLFFYFNAFSVQYIAINDRVQSASALPVSHVVTYYLVSVGILVRLFQYFEIFTLVLLQQTNSICYLSQKRLFCRRLSVYCVIKERICRFYPYFWSVDSQENHWACCHQMSYFKAKMH